MITLDTIIILILIFAAGPFVLGFLLGLIKERTIGLALLFLGYVLAVVFWQGGLGTPSGPPTVAKASWFFAFYLIPAVIGYVIALALAQTGRVRAFSFPRKK